MVTAEPLLSLREVAKSFSSGALPVQVLRRVNLDLYPGDLVALVGRSGSGKTTLLSLIIGWDSADRGELRWAGEQRDLGELRWGDLAIVPQALGLLPELTVEENITAPLFLDPERPAHDHRRLMDDLGIAHLAGRYPAETSLGEQQRAAVARALVLRPRVVLADEPLAHQNDEWTEVCLGLFAELAMEGTAFLAATHDLAVLQAADRAVELHDGRLHPLRPGETGGAEARRGSPRVLTADGAGSVASMTASRYDLLALPIDELLSRARDVRDRRHGHAGHVLAQGLHPADDAVPRPLRLLHVRPAAGPAGRAVPDAASRCSPIARRGAEAGCHEALFTLGERPEERYPVARALAGRARLRARPSTTWSPCAGWWSRRPACSPTPTPARCSPTSWPRCGRWRRRRG